MINLNQLGEAAGVAAVIAQKRGVRIADVPVDELRGTLVEGGSVLFT